MLIEQKVILDESGESYWSTRCDQMDFLCSWNCQRWQTSIFLFL